MENLEDQSPPAQHFAHQLVRYVAQPKRIFFCAEEHTWRKFPLTAEAAEEWNAATLCERFLRDVLPAVDDMPLDDLVRRHVEVLQLHPNFERCERGFRLKAAEQRVGYKRMRAAGMNLGITEPGCLARLLTDQEFEEEFFTAPKRPRTVPIITEPWTRKPGEHHLPAVRAQYQISPLYEAILSATLSHESELANRLTFTNEELHRRLVVAKRNFEDKAWQLANIKDFEQLQDSLLGLMEMKRRVSRLTSRYVSCLWHAETQEQ